LSISITLTLSTISVSSTPELDYISSDIPWDPADFRVWWLWWWQLALLCTQAPSRQMLATWSSCSLPELNVRLPPGGSSTHLPPWASLPAQGLTQWRCKNGITCQSTAYWQGKIKVTYACGAVRENGLARCKIVRWLTSGFVYPWPQVNDEPSSAIKLVLFHKQSIFYTDNSNFANHSLILTLN